MIGQKITHLPVKLQRPCSLTPWLPVPTALLECDAQQLPNPTLLTHSFRGTPGKPMANAWTVQRPQSGGSSLRKVTEVPFMTWGPQQRPRLGVKLLLESAAPNNLQSLGSDSRLPSPPSSLSGPSPPSLQSPWCPPSPHLFW